ncbi:hypothetical protein GCM10010313_78970 [Streptomyces violarus]|uniref:Uncharacterized protein n=1 Tax=Streptomyces violarus TaxID=67380 RepID=A0A7W5F2G9_9ACTN|nr:hypothetical protein [Streptomyces violarus]GHD33386.1 hypothetical protein GCM10010313_78970 [Streptomyces violarus]
MSQPIQTYGSEAPWSSPGRSVFTWSTRPEIDLPDVYLPEKKARPAFLDREVLFPG